VYKVDDHIGIAFAGLTADARLLSRYMRNEALNHKYGFSSPINPGRLVAKIGEKSQIKTQRSSKRPYGVGLLVTGVDETGPHIYETSPDANYYEYYAYAIGARCQSAKTYLENHYRDFENMPLEDLIRAGLHCIRKSTPHEIVMNGDNVSVSVVAVDHPFEILSEDALQVYFAEIAAQEAVEAEAAAAQAATD
jgi:20S proteasome subunit alpha 6